MHVDTIRPGRLRVSASTVCSLRCPTCPNGSGEIAKSLGEGYLRAAHLRDLLESNSWVREVEISGWGEPFLNPEMPTILEDASRRGVALTADNGTTFNAMSEGLLDALVKRRFRRITCSIDGASQTTYGVYRVNGDFNRVMKNIRRLNALKSQAGSRYPRLTWQFVVFGHNEHEIPLARRTAIELGMDFRLKESWAPELSPVRDRRFVASQHARGGTYHPELKRADPERAGRAFCHQLWEEPQVNWDGRILGCCCNCHRDFGGNAFSDGLPAALNSPSLRYARAMLLGRAAPREDIPCTACGVFRSMRGEGQYLHRGGARLAFRAARFAYRELGLRRVRQLAGSLGAH
jgi:MoaA/NifB/PqqE/SkfB family radical SAM enzyme